MLTWNFRTTTGDPGEVYKAEQLYFKRFSTYPQHPPLIERDRTGVVIRFALPGDPPPKPAPVKPPVTGEQLPLL